MVILKAHIQSPARDSVRLMHAMRNPSMIAFDLKRFPGGRTHSARTAPSGEKGRQNTTLFPLMT
jgi:hypothetical protein